MTHPFAGLATVQRAAAKSLTYHDEKLAEAIMHHCAMRTAAATAPTDKLVGRYVDAEMKALHRLLRMKVSDLEGFAVRGRYIRAYAAYDPGALTDMGTPEAMVDGMARAGK